VNKKEQEENTGRLRGQDYWVRRNEASPVGALALMEGCATRVGKSLPTKPITPLTKGLQSDYQIRMKTTLTKFQRSFRKAREAADRGDIVVVTGENGDYVFERRVIDSAHPFAGLEGVFGAVALPKDSMSLREKIRRRLGQKNGHRGRRAA